MSFLAVNLIYIPIILNNIYLKRLISENIVSFLSKKIN